MFFRIEAPTYDANLDELKAYIQYNAYMNLRSYPISTPEVLLDKYCKEHYKLSLFDVCTSILDKCKVQTDQEDIIITFETEEIDDIAKLITYGNGQIPGSRILSWSLGRID